MDPYAVDVEACRRRQQKFLEAIGPLGADTAILSRRESVQWLTGLWVRPQFDALAAILPTGEVTLVVANRQTKDVAAADDVRGYEAKWHSTTRDDQRAASAAVLRDALPSSIKRLACEASSFDQHLATAWEAELVDVGPTVFELRRAKDEYDLRMLRRANEANQAMYERAREIIEPGVNELDVYATLVGVAIHTLGEPLTYIGQDYRSNARGGAPRDRAAEAGELYILDLGVGFRGYHSDNARTIAVDGRPTDEQQRAHDGIASVFKLVEATVRPGSSCRQLHETVQEKLDAFEPWVFNHHLGHGVGLAPQEGPHLNPRWDDVFMEGDFFAVEPGLYHDDLRHGIRLEQNYRVTETGVELLTDWPLGL